MPYPLAQRRVGRAYSGKGGVMSVVEEFEDENLEFERCMRSLQIVRITL